MKLKTIIILGLGLLLVLVIGFYANASFQNQSSKETNFVKTTEITKPNGSSETVNQMESGTPADSSSNNPEANSNTTVKVESGYTDYNSSKLVNAQNGKVVLFFHAPWCPSCRGLDTNIKQNLDSIPKDLLILKVDYDSNQDLRNKYQITTQHTLVQVDMNGDKLKSVAGLYQINTLDAVLESFK